MHAQSHFPLFNLKLQLFLRVVGPRHHLYTMSKLERLGRKGRDLLMRQRSTRVIFDNRFEVSHGSNAPRNDKDVGVTHPITNIQSCAPSHPLSSPNSSLSDTCFRSRRCVDHSRVAGGVGCPRCPCQCHDQCCHHVCCRERKPLSSHSSASAWNSSYQPTNRDCECPKLNHEIFQLPKLKHSNTSERIYDVQIHLRGAQSGTNQPRNVQRNVLHH